MIRDIHYIGEYKNNYMSFDYYGLPPSIVKLLSLSGFALNAKSKNKDARSEDIPEQERGHFKHFASFMADNHQYLIPLDSPRFKDAVITEDLFNHVIHGRQKAVFDFDYSALEAMDDQLKKNLDRLVEIKNDQVNAINFTPAN